MLLDSAYGEMAARVCSDFLKKEFDNFWSSIQTYLHKDAKAYLIKLSQRMHNEILELYTKLPPNYSIFQYST